MQTGDDSAVHKSFDTASENLLNARVQSVLDIAFIDFWIYFE